MSRIEDLKVFFDKYSQAIKECEEKTSKPCSILDYITHENRKDAEGLLFATAMFNNFQDLYKEYNDLVYKNEENEFLLDRITSAVDILTDCSIKDSEEWHSLKTIQMIINKEYPFSGKNA